MSLRVAISAAVVAGAAAAPGTSPYFKATPGTEVPNQVIVSLDPVKLPNGKPNVAAQQAQINAFLAQNGFDADTAIHFPEISMVAVTVTDASKLGAVRNDAFVSFVEDVQVVKANQVIAARNINDTNLWGLDRVDQRALPYDGKLVLNGAGEGVDVYVADTGVHVTHEQFEGRASNYWTAYPSYNPTTLASGTAFEDVGGHGTHCSGTFGGKDYGVAPKVNIKSVRVLGDSGTGSTTGIVAGLTNVLRRPNRLRKAVVNMSLGGLNTGNAYTAIIDALVNDDVSVVVSAGNDNKPACFNGPAYVPSAITVGATDKTDTMSTFSNYGTCVDIFAPGTDILSSIPGPTNNKTDIYSGTSMAGPHVAGAVAVLRSQFPAIPAKDIVTVLQKSATPNAIKNIPACPQSPNYLLFARWSDANYKARTSGGSTKTDAWCVENKGNPASWDDCEIVVNNKCRSKSKGITDAWCEQVKCAPIYSAFCTNEA